MAVADADKASRHGGEGKVTGLTSRHLFPAERSRYRRFGPGADRIGGCHGPVLGILVVVHKHPVPLLLPPFAGSDRWSASLHLPCQGQSGTAHLIEAPPALDPNVYMDAARARGLGPPGQAEVLERL